ncbi:Fur family transcriptional regulator [Deinococcus sp. YIM 77859]|uniref:Fur family transcriptional regulator n=1 Tax=Deinococcus sp. YIM 77859 TaxID=1540221 RepID=UPI000556CCF6|nr:Fur family transcriptional regulator [Deinococcus sp. YIM 77859]
MSSATQQLQHLLEHAGLRVTQPRLRLLEFFARSSGHFTPEEIWDRLRASGHPISIATLYQNLKTFSEHGLIGEMIGQNGEVRYDTNLEPHAHLVCLRCGRLADITLELPDLRPRGQAQGWLVAQTRVDLQGLCPECQEADLPAP